MIGDCVSPPTELTLKASVRDRNEAAWWEWNQGILFSVWTMLSTGAREWAALEISLI